jgi:hypothetical protein
MAKCWAAASCNWYSGQEHFVWHVVEVRDFVAPLALLFCQVLWLFLSLVATPCLATCEDRSIKVAKLLYQCFDTLSLAINDSRPR